MVWKIVKRLGPWDGRRKRTWMQRILILADILAILAAGIAATIGRFGDPVGPVWYSSGGVELTYLALVFAAGAAWPLFLFAEHLYELRTLFWGSGEFKRVLKGVTLGAFSFVFLAFALKIESISRLWAFAFWILAMALVLVDRATVRSTLTHMRRRGRLFDRTLIVGTNADAAHLLSIILMTPETGLRPVGYVSLEGEALVDGSLAPLSGVPYRGHTSEIVEVIREQRIDTVLIVASAFDHDEISEILARLRGLPVDVDVSAGVFEVLATRMRMRELVGIPLLLVRDTPLSARRAALKRTVDVLVSSAVLLVGLPFWAALMVAIKLDSPGPVFYRQTRVGRLGATFAMFKFRSMRLGADSQIEELWDENEASGPLFKLKRDPRVTRVGGFLRKYSLDEIPQLLNVIHGEMSLVGPRPPLPTEVNAYSERDWRRLDVLPGMTGLWQVSGRSDLTFDEMIRLDLYYVQNWSFGLDGTILLRTIPAVLSSKGAY